MSSSKTARLHRRQAARHKKWKRLHKSGRAPQHARAERRHAEAERRHLQEAERRRQPWLRSVALSAASGVSMASFVWVSPTPAEIGHWAPVVHMYASISQVQANYGYPDHPDPPHPADPDGTYYAPYNGGGTTLATTRVGPVEPVFWGYGPYGPNIFGD